MKSILVIGIGRFGQHLCENLAEYDNEIMAVDISEERLEPILPYVVSAKIGDCTNEAVLQSLGVGNYDVCFVCIGNNFQNSLEITNLIKEMGAKYVVSKANRDIHNKVFDYTELADGISIYEIMPLKEWVGKSIRQLNIRQVYGISVVALKLPDGSMKFMPGADYVVEQNVHLMVMGKQEETERIIKQLR